jgi:hypothetical protein
MWLAQAFITIVIFSRHGLFKKIQPWLIFIMSFILSTLLNFMLISPLKISELRSADMLNWLSAIRFKLILFPLLPFLLLAAHGAFIKLVTKAGKAYSNSRIKKVHDLNPGYAGKSGSLS